MIALFYYTSIGVNEYRRFMSNKENFLKFEKQKVEHYTNYQQYSGYGFRVFYGLSPTNVFFVNSTVFKDIESNIDISFHWSYCFLIVDKLNNSLKPIENSLKNHPNERGDIINKLVKKKGIKAVITQEIGPRAFEEFKKHGIRIYQGKGNIDEAIRQLEKGKLSEITNV